MSRFAKSQPSQLTTYCEQFFWPHIVHSLLLDTSAYRTYHHKSSHTGYHHVKKWYQRYQPINMSVFQNLDLNKCQKQNDSNVSPKKPMGSLRSSSSGQDMAAMYLSYRRDSGSDRQALMCLFQATKAETQTDDNFKHI